MTIAWNHFTPLASLCGGLLIGLTAAALLLFNGRIAGISGIVGGLLRPVRGELRWRLAFIIGLLLAPWCWSRFYTLPVPHIDAGTGTLILAGLLVGFGSRLGSGCTSGHGVCGLSRRSPRSLAATATFMAAGFIVVLVLRHALA